ncbi:MAG: flagellar filament capping protein FliD [Pseudomonadota bacterium]|nr:flagellar filament capping protein FliD [Pseudomonadota bacterium]
MAAITAAGTGSGLDIESIIESLTEAERIPTQTRLDTREIEIQADISAYGSLKGTLKDFQAALSGLTTVNKLAARSAKSSDETVFTATAASGAAVGTTNIQVIQLASNHKLVSTSDYADADAAVGAGTLTIDMGGDSFSVDIVGGTNNTLTGIRDAINDAADNPGVTASILTVSDGMGGTVSKLVLTADETGADNALTITVTDDADGNDTDASGLSALINANMTEKSQALDAELLIDDEYTVTSSSNVFQDAIQGVTITAVSTSDGTNDTLSIGLDKTLITERLQKFVDEFNLLSETLNYLTDYDITEQEAGLLTGDFAARTIETQIRRTIGSAIEGASSVFSSLASIGITTQRDGSLALNSDKLTTALNSNFDDVAELLAGDDGIIKSLNKKLDSFLSSDGILASRNKTFLSQLEDIDAQREKLELRIESFEKRIRLQYTNLDILVGQLQSTGDFVTQQLDVIKKGLVGKD